MKLLVTGAAGFIGSSFVRIVRPHVEKIVVVDKLTYAGHLENLTGLIDNKTFFFNQCDIADREAVGKLLQDHSIDAVVNFAAESHVDNSIHSPGEFLNTNIIGTFHLLETCRHYFNDLDSGKKNSFRFLHVSTDEVFGALGETGKFSEETSYKPNSPYSASKASSDHLVRAWFHTYKLPVIITNCSNNYGPRQFPEKLIPLMIQNSLAGKNLPVYGTGGNIRDWIHVEDHSRGVWLALTKGTPGESYCFGGNAEMKNLDVVNLICQVLDEVRPQTNGKSYRELITFVQDRAGHDWRYAIDDSKAVKNLGFKRSFADFEQGLRQTIQWYLENQDWCAAVTKKSKEKK